MSAALGLGGNVRARKCLPAIFLPPFSCLLLLPLLICCVVGAAERPPNFVVIFADDLGYGDLSCYGPTGVETPNLDTLATEGFRSTDFFVPANVCSPSRAALLTGRYPMRCGIPVARIETPRSKYSNYGFPADELTIPELLKPAGYRSLMVGKWHLGMEVAGSHPIDAGFDEHLGIPEQLRQTPRPQLRHAVSRKTDREKERRLRRADQALHR